MGGELKYHSEPGKGSCFYFSIFLPRAAQNTLLVAPKNLADLRVLVIDDQPIMLTILQDYLDYLGMTVVCVESGQAAKQACEHMKQAGQQFDLVLVDWQMPGLDGFETLDYLGEYFAGSRPKVFMMTSNREADLQDRLNQYHIDSLIFKPITQSTLYNHLIENMGYQNLQASSGQASLPLKSLEGARILLVEDNPINQEIILELLRSEGLVMDVANQGQEALACLLAGPADHYDLVLMDLQMPVMDGYEATRRIRQDNRFADLPILAMTADAVTGVREKVLSVGMNDYLTKPIQLDILHQALLKWIKHSPRLAQADYSDLAVLDQQCIAILEQMQSLDLEQALQRAANHSRLLLKLVQRFHRHYLDFVDSLPASFGQPESAGQALHGFKGVAANLGLNSLFQAADALELALKQAADPQADYQRLQAAWRIFAEDIDRIQNLNLQAEQSDSREQLLVRLDGLAQQVTAFDIDAIQTLEEMIEKNPEHAERLQTLLLPLQNLEFAETEALLVEVIGHLQTA